VGWLIYNALQCELAPEDLKAHYNSYLAAGQISVYNLVSIMSAFDQPALGSLPSDITNPHSARWAHLRSLAPLQSNLFYLGSSLVPPVNQSISVPVSTIIRLESSGKPRQWSSVQESCFF
jgi:hypothetical protein